MKITDIIEDQQADTEAKMVRTLRSGRFGPQEHTHTTNQDLTFKSTGSVQAGSNLRYVRGSRQMYVLLKDGMPTATLNIPGQYVDPVSGWSPWSQEDIDDLTS